VIVLLLAAALVGAVLAVVPPWRALQREAHKLPVWGFARQRGLRLPSGEALRAELRCGMCDAKKECDRLLAAGERTPPGTCFNRDLLAQ
jgi:hypothetical protein